MRIREIGADRVNPLGLVAPAPRQRPYRRRKAFNLSKTLHFRAAAAEGSNDRNRKRGWETDAGEAEKFPYLHLMLS